VNPQTPKALRRRCAWVAAIGAALFLSLIFILYILISSNDIDWIKPIIRQVVKERTGRDLLIHGPVKLEIGTSPCLMVEKAALQNASWGTHPDMVLVEQMKLQIQLIPLLKKRIEVRSVTLIEPKILIETDGTGVSNFSFDIPPSKPIEPARTRSAPFRLGSIKIENGRFSFKKVKEGPAFSLTVDRLRARRAGDGVLMEVEMEGRYESEPFRLKGSVGTLESLIASNEPWRVDMTARAFGMEVRADGFLLKPISLQGLALSIKGKARSTRRIAKLLGLSGLPEMGPFQVEGEISGKGEKRFHLSGLKFIGKGLDGKGDLALNLKPERTEIKGSLSLKLLDISTFLQKETVRKKRQAPGREKKVFSPETIPLATPGFKSVEVDLDLKAEKVLFPHALLSELKTKVCLTGDHFMVRSLQFKAGGGEANGTLEVRVQERTTTLIARGRMDRVDVKTFLSGQNVMGKASAEIELMTEGSSIAAWLGGLEGHAIVSLNGLKFYNNQLKQLNSKFGSIILQVFAPSSKDANSTEINCLVGGFDIREGLAEVTTLLADTHELVVVGKGHLNLREETLDLSIQPYPKKGVGGVSFSLTELTKAFKLGGTFVEPSLRIDPLRSALTVGKMVGGMILLGPAGAAVVFAGQTADEGDLCAAAIEQAKRIDTIPGPLTKEEKKNEPFKKDRGIKDAVRSLGESAGRFFNTLSGRPGTPVQTYEGGP
jgi:AsmA family protein